MSGVLPETDIAEFSAAAAGTTAGALSTLAAFLVFNSGEDVALVHTAMVTGIITVTATGAIMYHKGITPGTMQIVEEIRERTPPEVIAKLGKVLPKIPQDRLDKITEKAAKTSQDYGAKTQGLASNVVQFKRRLLSQRKSKYGNDYVPDNHAHCSHG